MSSIPEQPESPRKSKLNTPQSLLQLILVVVFIGGAMLISAYLKYQNNKDNKSVSVTTDNTNQQLQSRTVESSTHTISFAVTGNTQVRALVNVVPQVTGKVTYVHPNFYKGGFFKAGQTLFKIEQADFVNEINRLEALVAQAQTQLKIQTAASQTARQEWKTLYPDEAPSPLVLQQPQSDEAKAVIKSARAQLATAKLNMKRTRYTLPYDGRVETSNVEVGQFIVSGQSYGSIYPTNAIEFVVPVTDEQLQLIQTDDSVAISINLSKNQQDVPAKILRIGGVVNVQTRLTDIFLKPNSRKKLMPQQFGTATFRQIDIQNAFEVPNRAIRNNQIRVLQQGSDKKNSKLIDVEILHQNDQDSIVKLVGITKKSIDLVESNQ